MHELLLRNLWKGSEPLSCILFLFPPHPAVFYLKKKKSFPFQGPAGGRVQREASRGTGKLKISSQEMGPKLFERVSQVTKTGLVGISASALNLLPTALDTETPVTHHLRW